MDEDIFASLIPASGIFNCTSDNKGQILSFATSCFKGNIYVTNDILCFNDIINLSQVKQHWLGDNYLQGGHEGNDIAKTNVPDIRASYRHETLVDELHILSTAAKDALASGSIPSVKH